MEFNAPDINYGGISPIIALTAGLVLTLLTGLVGGSRRRQLVVASIVGYATLAAAAGLLIAQWGDQKNLVAGALRLDDLSIAGGLIAIAAAAFVIPLSWREESVDRPVGAVRPRRVPGAADLLGARDDDDRPGPEPDRRSSSRSSCSRSRSTCSAARRCAARARWNRGSST